ncbi:MAG: hypothetical protein ACW98K_18035 [Candidatus Kariarchaeaceae archaeon]|jgi:hypothetical protein
MDFTKVIAIIIVGIIYLLDHENVDIGPWLIGLGLAIIMFFLAVLWVQHIKSSRTE